MLGPLGVAGALLALELPYRAQEIVALVARSEKCTKLIFGAVFEFDHHTIGLLLAADARSLEERPVSRARRLASSD